MNVTLQAYQAGGVHKLTVVARPGAAARLGEFTLMEAVEMPVEGDPTALDLLRVAYRMIADRLDAVRDLG